MPIRILLGVNPGPPLVSMQTSISWRARAVDVRLWVLRANRTFVPDSAVPTARTSACATPCGTGWYSPHVHRLGVVVARALPALVRFKPPGASDAATAERPCVTR